MESMRFYPSRSCLNCFFFLRQGAGNSSITYESSVYLRYFSILVSILTDKQETVSILSYSQYIGQYTDDMDRKE